VGPLLRAWRNTRGKSQLALAADAGVSTRHVSFIETGRSSPSREMVLTLADALDVPLRERNALLEAAGYAAVYRETSLGAPVMADVHRALSHLLNAAAPNPALVVNRCYDILMANGPAQRFLEFFAPAWSGRSNIASLVFSPAGLRPALANWSEVASHIAHRLKSELSGKRTPEEDAVLLDVAAVEADLRKQSAPRTHASSILIPISLTRGEVALDLFTTITTLGTPLDITLQELRIETLFPADASARTALDAIVTP